jgi:hypothetical protein
VAGSQIGMLALKGRNVPPLPTRPPQVEPRSWKPLQTPPAPGSGWRPGQPLRGSRLGVKGIPTMQGRERPDKVSNATMRGHIATSRFRFGTAEAPARARPVLVCRTRSGRILTLTSAGSDSLGGRLVAQEVKVMSKRTIMVVCRDAPRLTRSVHKPHSTHLLNPFQDGLKWRAR